jgi:indole-3-glycerol phosphate synthase
MLTKKQKELFVYLKDYNVIAESGIKPVEDINMYNDLGIFNFLIGESILRSKDYATFIKMLLNNG